MLHLLLPIIYLAFIGLGLPDSLLGSAWPAMYEELGAPLRSAGVVGMIISVGTIVSSLMSGRVVKRFGTGPTTAASTAMTAVALAGFSSSSSFFELCLWGIPYGLGAGSIDAALNNFVALHYASRHMSWLHCFWGIGATTGPFVMGLCLAHGARWNAGYMIIGALQLLLVICLIRSLPLWSAHTRTGGTAASAQKALGLRETAGLPGAKPMLAAFFCYCALESTTGLWAGSYVALHKGVAPETAATWSALFYLGITVGRFASGCITDSLGDERMARYGQRIALSGALLLPLPFHYAAPAGLALIGLGCAPIFPSLLHATPEHFGAEHSQSIMGLQMASAYAGTTIMPPLFGAVAERVGIALLPFILLLLVVAMRTMTELTNRIHARAKDRPQRGDESASLRVSS